MEDYIIKEISKIGLVLKAVLKKLNLLKGEELANLIPAAKNDIVSETGLDIDKFIETDEPIDSFAKAHNLNEENLSDIAEFLFLIHLNLAENKADDSRAKIRTRGKIIEIYRYLDKVGGTIYLSQSRLLLPFC